MKCHYHPEADAAQECRLCSHPLCPACLVQIKGVPYCPDCLAERVESAARPIAPSAPLPDYRSPRTAGWLSVLPGLGLLYLGQYIKALVVVLAFMGAIQFADHTDAGGILVPVVWFGQIFYAVQEARRLNRMKPGQAAVPETTLGDEHDSPVWGGILIGLGTLFLLDQFDLIRFHEIFEKFWPLLIIGLGLQILLRGRAKGANPARS
jgi:hypothetical protein